MGNLGKKVADKYRDLAHRTGAELENVESTVSRAADRVESTARQFGQDLGRV
jgi:hypothetical protein